MGEDFIKHDHEPCIHTRTLFMFLQLAQFTLEGLLTCKTLGECVSRKNIFFGSNFEKLLWKMSSYISIFWHCSPPTTTHARTLSHYYRTAPLQTVTWTTCMRGFIDKSFLLLLTIASRDMSEENISHSTPPPPKKIVMSSLFSVTQFLYLVRFTWVNNYIHVISHQMMHIMTCCWRKQQTASWLSLIVIEMLER